MATTHSRQYQFMLKRLRAARLEAGLTQVEVSKRLRQYVTYVTKIETGERRIDPIELQAFAKLYGKPVSHFLPRR